MASVDFLLFALCAPLPSTLVLESFVSDCHDSVFDICSMCLNKYIALFFLRGHQVISVLKPLSFKSVLSPLLEF